MKPQYKPDNGSLTADQIKQIKAMVVPSKKTNLRSSLFKTTKPLKKNP